MIISHNKGRGKKIHILVDNEYLITTDIDFWSEHYIKDGTDINEDELKQLTDAINYKKAVDKCYDLLSRRDHSVRELRTKLLRTVDEDSADRAIDRMAELGYLDDERYAKMLLTHLVDNKHMSRAFVKQEFYKRGIPSDVTAEILADYEFDNVAAIMELIATKYRSKLAADDGVRKVTDALLRKGFSYSDIRSAFTNIENEQSEE